MAQPFDVCIRGAGVVGRTLALLLARDRLRVALVDPASSAASAASAASSVASVDVRAYALNAASRALLQSLRCWPDDSDATPVRRMEVVGDLGGRVTFDAERESAEALAWIVDVPPLEARLTEALRYQPHIERVATPQPAALTVVCEGRASRTRDEFGVQYDTATYPQHAIAARLSATLPHAQVAHQWFLPDGILALLPMNGPDGHTVALVWSVDAAHAPALLALDDAAFAASVAAASGDALGALSLTSTRSAWPLQLSQADRWSGQFAGAANAGWVLAGDAAHTVHPLAGQGLNLGLADVSTLADVLRARDYWRSVGDRRLLRRYERTRKAALLPLGLATDGLQQLFSRSTGPLPGLRNWGMRGFDASGALKQWVARQAAGQH